MDFQSIAVHLIVLASAVLLIRGLFRGEGKACGGTCSCPAVKEKS